MLDIVHNFYLNHIGNMSNTFLSHKPSTQENQNNPSSLTLHLPNGSFPSAPITVRNFNANTVTLRPFHNDVSHSLSDANEQAASDAIMYSSRRTVVKRTSLHCICSSIARPGRRRTIERDGLRERSIDSALRICRRHLKVSRKLFNL